MSGKPLPAVVADAIRAAQSRRSRRDNSPFRQAVIQAIEELGPYAYAAMIQKHLARGVPPLEASCAQISGALRRMEKSGVVTSQPAASPIPGARGVVVFRLKSKASDYLQAT